MTAAELDRVCELALERRIGPVVWRTLSDAHETFGGKATGRLAWKLAPAGRLTGSPRAPQGRMRAALDDLRALRWRERVQMMRELFVPPADYMRDTYAPGSRLPLPLLYVRRIARGAGRWVRG
jgi:hypothetical protein